MAYEEVQCKKCKKMHPAFEYSQWIYYECSKGETFKESVDEYKKRIIED